MAASAAEDKGKQFMHHHIALRFTALCSLAMLLTACGGSGDSAKTPPTQPAAKPVAKIEVNPTPPAKTEALPADGGEVGKAYNELIAAYQTVDSERANRLVEQYGSTPSPLEKKDADYALKDMLKVHPTGGVRQGDRATLFLDGGNWHGYYSASHVGDAWVFDSSNPSVWEETPRDVVDCRTGKYFPCGTKTFPDTQVWGSSKVYRDAPNNNMIPSGDVMIDGYGVRLLDPQTKALKYTQIVLANEGFGQHALAIQVGPDGVTGFGPVFLRIAPDNKTAKLIFLNATPDGEHPETDATPGLTLDTSTPHRMRGHLKLDATGMAQFDLNFDVDTASECLWGTGQCGN